MQRYEIKSNHYFDYARGVWDNIENKFLAYQPAHLRSAHNMAWLQFDEKDVSSLQFLCDELNELESIRIANKMKNLIMAEVNRLYEKYPYGEFSCSPEFSPQGTHVSCNVCVDYKSNIYYFEADPVEELLEFLRKLK
jgi:hypothetical protein